MANPPEHSEDQSAVQAGARSSTEAAPGQTLDVTSYDIPVLTEEMPVAGASDEFESSLREIRSLRLRLSSLKSEHENNSLFLTEKLFEANELNRQLLEQRDQLKAVNSELQRDVDGEVFLERMRDAGIGFVASRPGTGEFSLTEGELGDFLASPDAFAARICGVDEARYAAWLAHREKPVCTHADEQDRCCELPVHRVASPASFEPGESDRCSQHRVGSMALSRVISPPAPN